MFFKKNLLLDISSFPVPSLAWKSYNRNLSSTHFALIHDLDNFALIWNIITTSTRICFLWPLIKCFLNFSCFLNLLHICYSFYPSYLFDQFLFYKRFPTFINDILYVILSILFVFILFLSFTLKFFRFLITFASWFIWSALLIIISFGFFTDVIIN